MSEKLRAARAESHAAGALNERTPDGHINNCAVANGDDEKDCQVCSGVCPDRDHDSSKIGDWLKREAQYALNEHVRPEYQALAKRGNITPAEVAELHANSWEWEHLIPAMNDEAFVERMEHAIANCGHHKRPYSTYNEAVEGLYAPELLRRFKLMQRKIDGWKREANGYAETIDAIREALGQKVTHYLVMPDDIATLVKALEWYASDPLEKRRYTRAKLVLALIRGMTVNVTCDRCGRKLILVLEVRPEDEAPATFCAECGGGCVALPPEEVLP